MKKITKFIKEKSSIFLALFALVIIPLFSGCGTASTYSVNLEIWGTMDESLVYDDIITQYKKINPYVLFRFRENDYRDNHFKSLLLRQVYVNREPSDFVKTTLEGNYSIFNARYSNSKINSWNSNA